MIHKPEFSESAYAWGFPYVSVFDEALSPLVCTSLIQKFEDDHDHKVATDFKDVRHFTEINISQHWQNEHEMFVACVQEAWKAYMSIQQVQFDIQWPKQFGYEGFRMKRYLPNGLDEFRLHTDVGNYGSARRFVSFLWYLNTVNEGGSTGFGHNHGRPLVDIAATRGRLLIFPPLWTHPHWGSKPLSGPKYVVSGYLHYI